MIQCENVSIGRGSRCDVRFADISVSRRHTTIKYEGNRFILLDNNSKFGTLVQIQKPLRVVEKINIQVGTTVITLQIQMKKNDTQMLIELIRNNTNGQNSDSRNLLNSLYYNQQQQQQQMSQNMVMLNNKDLNGHQQLQLQ